MKELPLSWWIGVLIGIFVFGTIASHVAGTTAKLKCYTKDLKVLDTVDDLKKAFTIANWNVECDATGKINCLQYFPKASGSGGPPAGMLLGGTECGNECDPAETKTKMKNTNGYDCFKCDSSAASSGICKTTASLPATNECYSFYELPGSVADLKDVKKVYCADACHHKEIIEGGTKKLFVGCAGLCKTANSNTDCNSCTDLAACGKLIAAPMCASNVNTKLETVTKITDALFKTELWAAKCNANQKCLQYFPNKYDASDDNTKGTGKVSLLVQCGDPTSCNQNAAVNKLGKGYNCHACDSRDSVGCKRADTITNSGVKECHEFDNEKQTGESASIPKIYCFDACQYKETGSRVKVNCAKDNAGGTDCPASDSSCAKMIFKPNDPTNSGGTNIPPGGNQATTTRPKTSNKLTISKYLLGSLAILLFATNQYMRQF